MVNFEENYHSSRLQRGSNIFQRGDPTFSRGGGTNCLFPIETHITCDFPAWVRTPCPPSGSALVGLSDKTTHMDMKTTITPEYEEEKRHFHSNRLLLFVLHKNNCFK